MKLHNLLLTLAFFSVACFAFAANDKNKEEKEKKEKKEKIVVSSHADFTSMANTESLTTLNYTVFRMNGVDEEEGGWDYSVIGYIYERDAENNINLSSNPTPKTLLDLKADDEGWITDESQIASAIKGLDLPEDVEAGLKKHAKAVYNLSVEVPDTVDKIGLMGGKGNGNTVASISGEANNGNQFFSIGEGNCIYFGKSNWLGKYNNGAMFVDGVPAGSPLPAPVVTLLIALGFGAALVMYRNRKQVKA